VQLCTQKYFTSHPKGGTFALQVAWRSFDVAVRYFEEILLEKNKN